MRRKHHVMNWINCQPVRKMARRSKGAEEEDNKETRSAHGREVESVRLFR